ACSRFVMITGCSGGGKSSLLAELARRGYRTFAEPGRQIFKEQTLIDGPALPAKDGVLFGELCISRTINRMVEAADAEDFVFFDRGLIDPLSHWVRLGLQAPAHWAEAAKRFRFHRKVFVAPPWPEIFESDSERRHSFEDAIGDYPVLLQIYRDFGYQTIMLPKLPVSERAEFILSALE
ncbi:MAG TPA: AAA family ATPase, partial [Rhizomicrobium sp.]